jgi:hypothetical protein
MRRLCPQQYEAADMLVTPCTRCSVGWDRQAGRCTILTGAEHFPLVPEGEVPTCPIQDRCQHQVQDDRPCVVRARGMICESALVLSGMDLSEAFAHPLAFNAMVAATPEEWAQHLEETRAVVAQGQSSGL